jgi:hypothetical protein
VREITFIVPVSASSAIQWQLTLPEKLYSQFKDDIDTLITSVKIAQR